MGLRVGRGVRVGLLAAGLVWGWAGRAQALGAGQKASDFVLPVLSGGEVRLKQLGGKVVLIDFWASWCAPCREELPGLEQLQKELGAKGLTVIAVSLDQERGDAERIVRQLGLASLTVALDPEAKVAEKYEPPKMPSSYVLDRKGTIRFVHAGFQGVADLAKLRREIESLLAH